MNMFAAFKSFQLLTDNGRTISEHSSQRHCLALWPICVKNCCLLKWMPVCVLFQCFAVTIIMKPHDSQPQKCALASQNSCKNQWYCSTVLLHHCPNTQWTRVCHSSCIRIIVVKHYLCFRFSIKNTFLFFYFF